MPFALFNLPYLALKEVFRSMDSYEILITSFASKRTKKIIKSTLGSSTNILIKYHQGCFITIRSQEIKITFQPQVTLKSGKTSTIISNKFSTHSTLIKYILEMYSNPKVTLIFFDSVVETTVLELIDTIKGLKVEVTKLNYGLRYSTLDGYKKIVDDCITTGTLVLQSRVHFGFEHSLKEPLRLDFFHVDISPHWVDLMQVIDCKRLLLVAYGHFFPLISNNYLNEFFKKLSHSNHRLEKLEMLCNMGSFIGIELDQITQGLDDVIIRDQCAEFRRRDGTKSRIVLEPPGLLMEPVIDGEETIGNWTNWP